MKRFERRKMDKKVMKWCIVGYTEPIHKGSFGALTDGTLYETKEEALKDFNVFYEK
ncbi:MAG: hypothetical protein ACRCXT_17700 [Paraclostridium sp.]